MTQAMRLKSFRVFFIYIPALFLDFALSSVLTNSAFYTSYLKLSSTFLGMLMAIATLFFSVLAIPFGRLSDKIDRRKMLFAACILLSVVSMFLPFCKNRTYLILTFPGIGISMALFWPAYEAWLAEREGEGKLLQRVMFFNLFWSIGVTLGPAVSGYLYEDTNPTKPFYLAAAIGCLTIVSISINRSETSPDNHESIADKTEILFPSTKVRQGFLNISRCANFASWFSLGVLRRLAPKLTKEMGIRTTTFGNLMLALGGIQTLTFIILGTNYSRRWQYQLSPLLLVQGLAILCFIGIWKINNIIFWLFAFAVIGISVAFTYFCSLYYGLDKTLDKGNKSGWHEAVLGFGSLLGPLLGGIAADSKLGPLSPYPICATVILLAIVLQVSIAIKNRLTSDVL